MLSTFITSPVPIVWPRRTSDPNVTEGSSFLINPDLPTLGTWKSQLYRFAVDPTNKEEFAKMHFQIIGQGQGYDPAEDHINPTKVKNHIYNNILPLLSDEALKQGTIFGKFVTPEEFADDMLRGLDPKNKPSISLFENKYQYNEMLVHSVEN